MDQKDSPEKEKEKSEKNRNQASCSSKSDQQKTPTKEQKDILKQEQQRLKSEQKAQQKLEKEHLKHEKELQKEQLKLEKEQHKLEKDQKSPSKNCFKASLAVEKGKEQAGAVLKTQKSIDVSSIKHQKSVENRPPARNSVDLQFTRDLLEATDISDCSAFSSSTSLAKPKTKK